MIEKECFTLPPETLEVTKIAEWDGQLLIYDDGRDGDPFRYYVIAELGTQVVVGDIITYQPAGHHFGYFIQVGELENENQ